MAFKKVTDSQTDGMYIIGSSDKSRYPVGFQYRIGGTLYTVREDATKDAGSEMRRVITSDGSVEIMTLESIDLDLREPDAQVIDDGKPKEPVQPEQPKPVDMKETELPKEEKKGESDEFEGLDW
jgi:hypothetical protein